MNLHIPGCKAVAAVLLTLASHAVATQEYPSKPVKTIVPAAAGGVTDILARTVGRRLSEARGRPVRCTASCMHRS